AKLLPCPREARRSAGPLPAAIESQIRRFNKQVQDGILEIFQVLGVPLRAKQLDALPVFINEILHSGGLPRLASIRLMLLVNEENTAKQLLRRFLKRAGISYECLLLRLIYLEDDRRPDRSLRVEAIEHLRNIGADLVYGFFLLILRHDNLLLQKSLVVM